ncbi:MFS transporter [Pararoseomonas indoligenes]|uniref:MFS transporter n=1 Tax=Roseomonas indoligenes TaxID=2820811 RepID=A0A940S349_9PROT|nr:MFS transporter [Pararoseomonas indoligenes]MBP0491861.1 MFS transporter [Pararoseomonas indoligenes]
MNETARPPYPIEDGLPMPQRILAVIGILLGNFLGSLDSSIANVALPSIATDLGGTPAAAVWVVNGYQLATAVALLPLAVVGERRGAKRLYLGGMVIFTIASVGCAMAGDLGWLVAARVLQGLGGACSSVVGGVLMRQVFPQRLIGRGIGLFGLSVAISTALGPSVAAGILTVASWRWLFLVNIPLGILALLVAARFVPESRTQDRPYDLVGTLLNAVGIVLLVLGVDRLSESLGWGLAEVAAGLAVLAGLLLHQRTQRHPLVPLDLLRLPVFALSFGTSTLSYAAQTIAYVSLPFFLQHGLGYDEVRTGLLITPWPLVIVLVAPLSGHLSDRYPAGILSSTGLALLAMGLLALALLPEAPSDADIIWRMVLCGIGFGFFQTPNNRAILTAGPPQRTGAANGMMAQARLFGMTLGAAVVAVGFGALGGDAATVPLLLTGAALAAGGAAVSLARLAA